MRIIIPLHELEHRYNASFYKPLDKYIDFDTMVELLFLDNNFTGCGFYIWEYIEAVDTSVCEDINLVEIIAMMIDVFGCDFDRVITSFININIVENTFVSINNSVLIVDATNIRGYR
jgi:hypothetical protein